MDRNKAIAIVKELTAGGLIETSWVSIGERKPNDFQLEIKGDANSAALQEVVKKRNLVMVEKFDRGIVVIYDP